MLGLFIVVDVMLKKIRICMFSVCIKENEYFDVVLCRFKCVCEKVGVLMELCCCEYYEKFIQECKCRKVVVVKCYLKCINCEDFKCKCLY